MRSERQVRRTRSKVIVSYRAREWETETVGRGFLPREITFSRDHLRPTWREFAWPLSARGAYTILSDEDIKIGGLSDFDYCWRAVVGGTREGVQVKGGAAVRGAAPVGSRGEAPAGTATKRT